jgi:hypothetical protein
MLRPSNVFRKDCCFSITRSAIAAASIPWVFLTGVRLPRGACLIPGKSIGVELDGHPFFIATLFQPERAALQGRTPPVALTLVKAAASISD